MFWFNLHAKLFYLVQLTPYTICYLFLHKLVELRFETLMMVVDIIIYIKNIIRIANINFNIILKYQK
jgi:hypothetical protein